MENIREGLYQKISDFNLSNNKIATIQPEFFKVKLVNGVHKFKFYNKDMEKLFTGDTNWSCKNINCNGTKTINCASTHFNKNEDSISKGNVYVSDKYLLGFRSGEGFKFNRPFENYNSTHQYILTENKLIYSNVYYFENGDICSAFYEKLS